MSELPITRGCEVSLHFALKLEDGEVVDSNFGRSPARLVIGDGNLPPSFEAVLLGLCAGDKKIAAILPEKAFGMPKRSSIQMIPRAVFKQDMVLEEGLVVSFSDAANSELPGVIRSLGTESVEVDFNHPLAGRQLQFEVEILEVDSA